MCSKVHLYDFVLQAECLGSMKCIRNGLMSEEDTFNATFIFPQTQKTYAAWTMLNICHVELKPLSFI